MATARTTGRGRRHKLLPDATRPQGPAATDRAPQPDGGWEGEEQWYLPHRTWPWVAGLVIAVLGLGDAAYLTWAHYHPAVQLACPTGGVINCAAVTTSAYSRILGIPVALLGLCYFAGMLPLQTPWAWRSPNRLLRGVRLGGAVVGIGMVLWLVTAELFLIGKICEYCTGVHLLSFALLVTTAFGTIATAPRPASEL